MKTIFKVEQSDLVGNIKNFFIEVVEKMIEEQVKQGNQPNIEVFQNNNTMNAVYGGFDWDKTDDGVEFWSEVIVNDNFDLFFERYPKKNNTNLVYIIGDSEIGMNIIKTLEKYGGINRLNYNGNRDDVLYYINPNNNIEMCCKETEQNLYEVLLATYTPIEAEDSVFEVTMEEIAEKFGVDINNLRIKK